MLSLGLVLFLGSRLCLCSSLAHCYVCALAWLTAMLVLLPGSMLCLCSCLAHCYACALAWLTAMFVLLPGSLLCLCSCLAQCYVCALAWLTAMLVLFPGSMLCLCSCLAHCCVCALACTGNMSLAPGDNVPPSREKRPIVPASKDVSEGTSRQEMDRQRKEQSRFKTGQQLVEGINNIIANAQPVADGVRIIQNAMQLPAEEGVWLIKAINAANEWDIFNSMSPQYREFYVLDASKARRRGDVNEGSRGLQSQMQIREGDDAPGCNRVMPPSPIPPPNQFLS